MAILYAIRCKYRENQQCLHTCSIFLDIEFYYKLKGFFGYLICIKLCLNTYRFILYAISIATADRRHSKHCEPNLHNHTCLDKACISAEELTPSAPPLDLNCLDPTLKVKPKKENRTEKDEGGKRLWWKNHHERNAKQFSIKDTNKQTKGFIRTQWVAWTRMIHSICLQWFWAL